ncbi:MAG: diguanylate cyclase [Pseudomonadota bacterium]
MAGDGSLSRVLSPARFLETAESEWERARRYDRPLCVLMVQVDGLREIARSAGARRCEVAMAEVAACVSAGLRKIDTRGRLGPNEFGLLLPETRLTQAELVAVRLQDSVEDLEIEMRGGTKKLRANIGLASLSPRMQNAKVFLMTACSELRKARTSGSGGLSVAKPDEIMMTTPRSGELH